MDVDAPTAKRNEVRIRVRATCVTSSDTYVRGLRLPFVMRMMARVALGIRAPRQPILGMVLAGEVESAGPDVSSFEVGDQVFGMDIRRFGAYAELVCWPQSALLAPRPANLTYEEAAALPYGGLIASYFLKRLGLQRGERIAIYGASGAVGTCAVQLARHLGAEVTGVCGPTNAELVRSLGAATVIDYTVEDFRSNEHYYDVIFDAVGKRKSAKVMAHAADALRPGGRSMSVDDRRPRLSQQDLVRLKELSETGEMKAVIDRRYPLAEIVEAHRYVDAGHKKGNVIITLPGAQTG